MKRIEIDESTWDRLQEVFAAGTDGGTIGADDLEFRDGKVLFSVPDVLYDLMMSHNPDFDKGILDALLFEVQTGFKGAKATVEHHDEVMADLMSKEKD
jgi:hypothetical protein